MKRMHMKRMKRGLILAALTAVLAGLMCVGALALDEPVRGTCGTSTQFVLETNGTLTISGRGRMSNFSASRPAPWKAYASAIKKIEFKNGVASVGDYAFSGCGALTEVTLRDTVNRIGRNAFADCGKLTRIELTAGLTSIDEKAFSGCKSLGEVTIPAAVTAVGSYAFQDCVKLEQLSFEGVPDLLGISMFSGCVALAELALPDGLTTIPAETFRGCTALARILLPESVTEIGENAFALCGALAEVEYLGSEAEWNAVAIAGGNTALTGAKIIFNADAPATDVNAYVNRAYSAILGRPGDAEGITHWTAALNAGASAGEIIDEFFRSDEYRARGFSNEETVTRCYRAMLGREPDAAETANWAAMLRDGYSTTKLVSEFVSSEEFGAICAAAGLTAGSIELNARDQNGNITRFVQRCYTNALDREADEAGLNEWCAHLLTQELTPERVAFGFVFSDEAGSRNLDRAAFMTMLYQMMMDRGPDAAGLANWVSTLESYERSFGTEQGRQEVYKLFAASEEFALMLNNFGF